MTGKTSFYGGFPQRRSLQGRYDLLVQIKRAEAKLLDWESKLHLMEKSQMTQMVLDEICVKAREISDCNIRHGCIKDISDGVTAILSLAHEIYE